MTSRFFSKFALPNSTDYAPRRSTEFYRIQLADNSVFGQHIVAHETILEESTVAIDGGEVISSVADSPDGKRYAVSFHSNLYLGPSSYDEPEKFWFINHSCDSNLARIGGLVYIAKRDINEGEQLTVDYAPLVTHVPDWRMECRCGSNICRGVVTGTDWKNPIIAAKLYREWLPEIQKKLNSKE